MAAVSPASSPRLPSPPPMAEDQIGPTSPGGITSDDFGKLGVPQNVDHSAARRIRPGTKAVDMAKGPPLMPLTEIDSPFQLTEHLKALHYSFTHLPDSETSRPIEKSSAEKLAQAPEGVSRELWLYELCRFHTQNLNSIVIALFSSSPPCSSQTCPDMRASEWQYLCAVHDPPKSCCAIDYCCHTLDWAGNILTSPKHFPSRLHLGSDVNSPDQQLRQLTNIFRRLYRIFAHAWFQHREVFWQVENQSGLYIFFKTVIDMYNLLPADGYTIAEEAEGIQDTPVRNKSQEADQSSIVALDPVEEENTEETAEEPRDASAETLAEDSAAQPKDAHEGDVKEEQAEKPNVEETEEPTVESTEETKEEPAEDAKTEAEETKDELTETIADETNQAVKDEPTEEITPADVSEDTQPAVDEVPEKAGEDVEDVKEETTPAATEKEGDEEDEKSNTAPVELDTKATADVDASGDIKKDIATEAEVDEKPKNEETSNTEDVIKPASEDEASKKEPEAIEKST